MKTIEIELGNKAGYVLSALIGAIGGAIFVIMGTKAFPKMMSGMMQNMASEMQKAGCSPAEI